MKLQRFSLIIVLIIAASILIQVIKIRNNATVIKDVSLSKLKNESTVLQNSNTPVQDSMGAQSVPPDPNTDLQLYLRMSTINPLFVKLYDSVLVQSMQYFWPVNVNLVIVLDNERPSDHEFGDARQKAFPSPSTCYMEPVREVRGGLLTGKERMRRDMFYPEVCTTKKYVGFIETDTMFITRVIPDMLFSDGKPIIIGVYGHVMDSFYERASKSTENIFQTKEVMRCMSNFPIIVKVDHLIKLRQHVENIHNTSLEEVLATKVATDFSQYNLMCQYIWMYHRDEYTFHLSYQRKENPELKPARESPEYYDKELTEEQKTPIARVALHYKYVKYVDWKKEATWRYLLTASLCYAGGFQICPEMCTHFNINGIRPEMFIFHYLDWTWDARCFAAQKDHYARIAAFSSPWYSDVILTACKEIDTIVQIRWSL